MTGAFDRRGFVVIAPALFAGALGGCAASADFTYGEFQYGPGYQTERVYGRRVYGDTSQGLASEACRGAVRRHVNASGETVVTDNRACDRMP
ncbi:hypothetical protein [Microvirga terricola]|uniref:Lipoprotein n=1 Tax=Microvirga terricola TaxID=2719797 RepID=A0ABX0VD44_9HYPH|nr:hypothetical protein [Microvirga terricola]NIX76590.1 hypothetical protein [Microvirga terricola]